MLKPAHCDADIAIGFVHAANVVGVDKELGQRIKKHEECDQFVVGCNINTRPIADGQTMRQLLSLVSIGLFAKHRDAAPLFACGILKKGFKAWGLSQPENLA